MNQAIHSSTIVLVPHRTRPFCDLDAKEAPRESKGSWGCLMGLAGATAAVMLGYYFGYHSNRQDLGSSEPAAIAIRSLVTQNRKLEADITRRVDLEKQLRRELDTIKAHRRQP